MKKINDNLYFIELTNPTIYSKLVGRYNFLKTGLFIQNNGINSGSLSGSLIPFPYEFWKESGRGYFSGNYAKITGINNYINYKDSTFIIDFEKTRVNSSTLISNIKKDNVIQYNQDGSTFLKNVNQGFEFGITANNNLYFEYYEPSGQQIFIQESNLSNKSSVYLNISENTINFGYFDFTQNITNNSSFNINSNYIFNPSDLYIGYNPESFGLYNNNQPFVGYIDNFIIASGLSNREISNVCTGFVYDTYVSGGELTSGIVTGVTGRLYGITGTGFYITGFQKTATGVIYDAWGFETIGYVNSPLYGLRPLYGFTNLTGSFFEFFNEPLSVFLTKNIQKYSSYNKDYIKFSDKKVNDDLIEICLVTEDTNKINNKNLFLTPNRFDYGYFLPNRVIENPSLFINGQYQISGQIIEVPFSYDSDLIRIFEKDYGIENQKIVPYFLYGPQSSDSVFVDFNTIEPSCLENFYFEGSVKNASWNFKQKITGDNPGDEFGRSVAINDNGNLIMFGGPYDDANGISNAGAALVYINSGTDGWQLKQKITGDNIDSYYGESVAMNKNGTVLMIGGRNVNDIDGTRVCSTLIYTGNINIGWQLRQKITSGSNFATNIGTPFETAIAINNNGTILMIGAIGEDSGGIRDVGAALIYTGSAINGWSFKQKLTGDSIDSYYGESVATNSDGTVLMLGGSYDDPNGVSNAGAALLYTGNALNGWSLKQKLTGDNVNSYYGASVTMNSNETVLMMGGSNAALIYTGDAINGWSFKQKLTGDNINSSYGASITTNSDGTIIAIGGPTNSPNAVSNAGATIIYTGSAHAGWELKQKITGDSAGDQFGRSVAINSDGAVLIMGGAFDDAGETNAGAALIFKNQLYSSVSFPFDYNKYDVFFNGQKLISGIHFIKMYDKTIKIDNFTDFYFNTTGNLCFIPKNYDYSYIESGKSFSISNKKYYEGLSEIYVNGIRQTYRNDYNELSTLNINTGVLFLEQLPDIIYNN